MTKKEFIELYAEKGGFTKKEAERAVALFLDTVEDTLLKEIVSHLLVGKMGNKRESK